MTYIVGVQSARYCKESSYTCVYRYWYRKQLQGVATESGTSLRGVHQSKLYRSSREDLEEVLAELAGAHHLYRFELEDTSSADHSDSSNEENELQEDRLIDIPLGNCVLE